MNTSHERALNGFTNPVNKDVDYHALKDQPIAALNMRINEIPGSATPLKGNTLIEYGFELPAGTNTSIGCHEDKQGNSLVDFIFNTNGDHSILRYFQDTGETVIIAQGSVLNFSLNTRVTHAEIIDDYLYWTDATDRTILAGNPPRKINMPKANTNKILQYQLVFGDNSFTTGAEYRLAVFDQDGAVVTASQVFYTVPGGSPTEEDVLDDLIVALATFDIDAEIFFKDVNTLIISHEEIGYTINLSGETTNAVRFIPYNFYGTISYDRLTLIKPVPACPPYPEYVADAGIITNRLYGFAFQFRYRYVFDDGEKSKWGPASYVATNFRELPRTVFLSTPVLDNDPTKNTIVITIEDDRLDNANWLSIIRAIEVCFRTSIEQPWRLIDQYPIEALGVEDHEITFINEGGYPVVPSDEASAPDAQALGNFDFVPHRATALASVSDKNGNYILALGGCEEGFDVDAVKADLTIIDSGEVFFTSPNAYKTLKGGGTYGVGVIYEDEWGRQSPVQPLGNVRIPTTRAFTETYAIKIDFITQPPIWAYKYRIAITPNQNQVIYSQLPAWEVTYWKYDASNDNMTSSTYSDDPDYVGFTFNGNDLTNEQIRNYIFDTVKNSARVFLPENRDRIQIVRYGDNRTDDEYFFNVPIAGYSLTWPNSNGRNIDTFSVFYKHDTDIPEIEVDGGNPYIFVELYRPNKGDLSEIYYELGDCNDVLNPGLSNRAHDQPDSGFLELPYGDTYVSSKLFYENLLAESTDFSFGISGFERPNMDFSSTDVLNDLGRQVVDDPDASRVFDYDKIRVSDIYITGGKVNGLASFRGVNYIRVNRRFGAIQNLVLVETVLLAICRSKTQPIYISSETLLGIDGNSLQAISDQLFNIADPLQDDYGTGHPESVAIDNGVVYGFDYRSGVVWRYSKGGGQYAISNYGYRNAFSALGRATSRTQIVLGGTQKEFMAYYLKFPSVNYVFYEQFQGIQEGWMDQVSFLPDAFGKIGNTFYTLKNGLLYQHELGTPSNFYGTQYDNTVTIVVNDEPTSLKQFWNFVIESDKKFYIESITIPATASYASGMTSRVPAGSINLYEGQFKADFLRDSSDPNYLTIANLTTREITALLRGRTLRGEVMIVKLRLVTPGESFRLRSFQTFFGKSEQTS